MNKSETRASVIQSGHLRELCFALTTEQDQKEKRIRDSRAEGGFTLLEILIALFIFALIVFAVLTTYRGSLKLIDETEFQEDIYQMARIALARITEDLASAYFSEMDNKEASAQSDSEGVLFYGEEQEIEGLPCAEMRFLSLAHLDFSDAQGAAEPAEIAYYGSAEGREGVLDLYRSDTPLGRDKPEAGTGGLLLCKGLASIRFTFWDAEGEPHEAWDSREGFSRDKLPSRVSIVMEFHNPAAPENPYRFMSGVAIPMGG
jgi:general secretion pathway protein J